MGAAASGSFVRGVVNRGSHRQVFVRGVPQRSLRLCGETKLIVTPCSLSPAPCLPDPCLPALLHNSRVQPFSDRRKVRCRPSPSQLVEIIEEWNVRPKRSQRAKQQCFFAFANKCGCQSACICGVHAPFAAVRRNPLDSPKLGQHCSRGFRAPARQSRISVRGIAYQRQVIRYRRR